LTVTNRYGLRDLDSLNRRDDLKGISGQDIGMAQTTGMSAEDVETLRMIAYTYHLLLVLRCPKQNTRQKIGELPAKPWAADAKSDADGIGPNDKWASDYDLMGIFGFANGGQNKVYERIKTSLPTARKDAPSKLTDAATRLIRLMNNQLSHPFQHGANDDWKTPDGRLHCNVEDLKGKRYVAFTETGWIRYIPSFNHLHKFYRDNALDWPYG
jgi:hypothetical protein